LNLEIQSTPRYTIAICKGSALVEETKTLLRAWLLNESIGDFQSRVLREDLLGRATAYRVKDIVRRVFARHDRPNGETHLDARKKYGNWNEQNALSINST
jgi:bacteriophage exclusion system BrxA-like protein